MQVEIKIAVGQNLIGFVPLLVPRGLLMSWESCITIIIQLCRLCRIYD